LIGQLAPLTTYGSARVRFRYPSRSQGPIDRSAYLAGLFHAICQQTTLGVCRRTDGYLLPPAHYRRLSFAISALATFAQV